MFKRSGTNYSLWPEHGPRRGRRLKFAAGSFVLGAVCATAYGALFNFTAPATGQGLSVKRAVEPVPIIVERQPPVEAAVPVPVPRPFESESRPGRARTASAKVMLPLIGAPSPRPSDATDGRGDDGLAGEVRLTEPDTGADNVPSLLGDENERTVQKMPAKKPESTPAAGVPVPRVAPPQAAAVNEAAPPTSEARAKKEPAGEPKVQTAATEKAVRAVTTDSRTERGTAVLTKREEPMTLAGGDDAQAREPSAAGSQSKAMKPAATKETRTERRGVIVLAKREQSAPLAGGDNAQAREPSVQAAKSKAESPSGRRGIVVLKKKNTRPPRYSRADDASAREPVAQTAKSKKAKTVAVSERRAKPRKSIARTRTEKPTRYAARARPMREKPVRRVAGRRQDRLSSMIAQANHAFRAFSAGRGFTVPSGF